MSTRFVDKYRPRTLSDVVGQPKGVAQLQGLLESSKVAGNTILLSGPYGVGKTTIARILAKAVNCKAGKADPCGECNSCLLSLDKHPDITEINAAETRGIDDVRTILSQANFSPRYKARVFILDELHQLTGPAAQAFLKMLEEPPKHTVFILCTTDPYKLLPTIRSRATWVKLAELAPRDITRLLNKVCKQEGISYGKEILSYIADLSSGHARDSLNLLEQLYAASPDMTAAEAKEQLPEIAEGILGSSPDALVPKYVDKMLSGSLTPMVYLRKVEHPEHFLGLIIKFLKELTIYKIEPRMVDNPSLSDFVKNSSSKHVSSEKLVSLFEIHLDAQQKSRHLSDPLDMLDLAILKSYQVVKS